MFQVISIFRLPLIQDSYIANSIQALIVFVYKSLFKISTIQKNALLMSLVLYVLPNNSNPVLNRD